MKLSTVVILMVGGVLVYSAVKDKNPMQVLKQGMQGKSAPANAKPAAAPTAMTIPPTTPSPTVVSV